MILTNEITSVVAEIGRIKFTGDVIPPSWYQFIKRETSGGNYRTDTLAVAILANIVYWYSPTEVRDELTNLVTGQVKKFRYDKLQRSYEQLATYFGVSIDTAKSSVNTLVNLGLITREFRTVQLTGLWHNNVMFLEPRPKQIRKITIRNPLKDNTPYAKILGEGYGKILGEGMPKKTHSPMPKFSDTNTENSLTENTTENTKQRERDLSKLNHMNFFDKFYKTMEEKKYSPSLRDSYDSKIINLHIEEDKLTIEFDSLVRTADKLFELSARRDELSEFALRSTGVQNPEYSISFLNQKRKAINNAYSEIPAIKPQVKNIQTTEKPRQAVLYNSWEALIAWSKRSGMSRDIMEELGKIKTRVEANCVYLDTIVSERAKILIEKYFAEGEPPVKLIFKK